MTFLILLLLTSSGYASDLVRQSCIGCHAQKSQIAPAFEKIYDVYNDKSGNQKDLIKLYSRLISNPSIENVLLKDMYKQYGPMPKITLSKNEIEEISRYLARGNYSNLYLKGNVKLPKNQLRRGKAILKATKSELGKNLLKAIKNRKTIGAVSFCNTKALPITNEKIKEFNASIKRATDKPRNLNNLANLEEMKYIQQFKKQLRDGKALKPVIVKRSNKHFFYSPIVSNQMCLQCHGQIGPDIKPDIQYRIKKLYPKDLAVGYSTNQIRGIFSINWKDGSEM